MKLYNKPLAYFAAMLVLGFFVLQLVTQKNVYAQNREFASEKQNFVVTELVKGLEHPWGMAFLPGGDILVTEIGGHLRLIREGELLEQEISGLPKIKKTGQGGLLGIALHPDFTQNQWVYLSYAGLENGQANTEVLRGRLQGMTLRDVETVFKAFPKTSGGRHFGSRLLFGPDKTLYIRWETGVLSLLCVRSTLLSNLKITLAR